MCYGVGSGGVEIGLKGPGNLAGGHRVVCGVCKRGMGAVMEGGAMGAGPGTEASKLATGLEAIFHILP